jgi:tetratricopeptide (TPR) repeat protein
VRILYLAMGVLALGHTPAAARDSGWIRLRTDNFEVISNASPRAARDTLRSFEQIRSFFLAALPGVRAAAVPVRIVAFRGMKDYEPYRPAEFAAAHFQASPEMDQIVLSRAGGDMLPMAVHEHVHLIVRHSGLDLSIWLNEGIAELYSTLKPMGDKMLVGSVIPGRLFAIRSSKWVPLPVIFDAGRDSPYYMEKDKAGSLYNQSWALTHMLVLSEDYRKEFPRFFSLVAGGASPAEALETVYGKTVARVEKELQAYVRGDSFQAALFPAGSQPSKVDPPVESLADYDLELALISLSKAGAGPALRQRILDAIAREPARPEGYAALAFLEVRQGRFSEAREAFAKAVEAGSRNPGLLLNYGRLAMGTDPEASVVALSKFLELQPAHVEARLDLATVQIGLHRPVDALRTLSPLREVTRSEAPRLFKAIAHANSQAGNRQEAIKAAERFVASAQTAIEKEEAARLLALLRRNDTPVSVATAIEAEAVRPTMRRASRPAPHSEIQPELPSFTGVFVELECMGSQANAIIANAQKRLTLLIDEPNTIAIRNAPAGTVELRCGAQPGQNVRAEFLIPDPPRPGVDGLLRAIEFLP